MKKIDRLILGAFIGPFVLTTAVVVFILLIQQLSHHIDDLLGKGLSYWVFAELCGYFAVHFVPMALPLAILLSSLITFGNLGEHMELTALKGAGISLIRVLAPIFVLTLFVSVGSYFFSDKVLPIANLEAYRLLWDIKQKSPSLSIKEGSFYNGLPGYSIKINHKYPDGKSIKDIMIYDHTDRQGNTKLILADSGRMYTIRNDRYLVLELFKGKSYNDKVAVQDGSFSNQKFLRNSFDKSQVVFDLSSFDMQSTDKRLFQQHRYMRTAVQLIQDIDSMEQALAKGRNEIISNLKPNYRYHLKESLSSNTFYTPQNRNFTPVNDTSSKESVSSTLDTSKPTRQRPAQAIGSLDKQKQDRQKLKDSLQKDRNNKENLLKYNPKKTTQNSENIPSIISERYQKDTELTKNTEKFLIDEETTERLPLKKVNQNDISNRIVEKVDTLQLVGQALTQARNIASFTKNYTTNIATQARSTREYTVEFYRKFALAFACISMFLIGAPLGSIIKKGGLGVPVLVSIIFFIFFYVFSNTGEKWVKEDFVHVLLGMSMANIILLCFGFVFLRQARNDSRLFETDFYLVWWDKIKSRWRKNPAQ